jgi:hypothetical protein
MMKQIFRQSLFSVEVGLGSPGGFGEQMRAGGAGEFGGVE